MISLISTADRSLEARRRTGRAVEGLPVRWAAPDTPQGVALWLTQLGGSAEQTAPMLARLSERELLAASLDPPGHGRRSAGGEPWELAQEVLGVVSPPDVAAGGPQRARVAAPARLGRRPLRGCRPALGEDHVLLDQGEADRYAQWIFGALNPVTHLETYERDVAIAFCALRRDPRSEDSVYVAVVKVGRPAEERTRNCSARMLGLRGR